MAKEFVPLLQTIIWLAVIVLVGVVVRRDLGRLWNAVVLRIEQGGAIEVGPVKLGELRAELAAVREDVTRIERVVAELFLTTMSDAMFENLRKLATGHFGKYDLGKPLERELYHLRDIGYIAVHSIQEIPKEGPDLSAYVSVTEPGKKFVRLREEIIGRGSQKDA